MAHLMAHFAQLNNNTVVQVIVISNADLIDENGNENEQLGAAICEQVAGPGPWIQTSYNGNFRRRYAGIGHRYDATLDAFITPQPFPSWTLDHNHDWQPPTPKPDDENEYEWDETSLTWIVVSE